MPCGGSENGRGDLLQYARWIGGEWGVEIDDGRTEREVFRQKCLLFVDIEGDMFNIGYESEMCGRWSLARGLESKSTSPDSAGQDGEERAQRWREPPFPFDGRSRVLETHGRAVPGVRFESARAGRRCRAAPGPSLFIFGGVLRPAPGRRVRILRRAVGSRFLRFWKRYFRGWASRLISSLVGNCFSVVA